MMKSILIPIIVATGVAGCGAIGSQDAIEFGTTTSNAVPVLNTASTQTAEVLLALARTKQACQFLKGNDHYRLAASPTSISPRIHETIEKQRQFVAALNVYAQALVKVTDPNGLTQLRSAAGDLSKTVTGIFTVAAAASPGTALVGPIVTLVVNGIVNVSEINRRAQIRDIAAETHDAIEVGTLAFRASVVEIRDYHTQLVNQYEREARCVLRNSRENTNADAFLLFERFDATLRQYRQVRDTLETAVDTMVKIETAHKGLLDGDRDFQTQLGLIENTISDILAVEAALRPNT